MSDPQFLEMKRLEGRILSLEDEVIAARLDAAEARKERDALRAELAALRARKPFVYSPDAQAMSDRVKAAEAERDALREALRKSRQWLPLKEGIDAELDTLIARIDALLGGNDEGC